MTTGQFPKIELIDRDIEQNEIRELANSVAAMGTSRVLYFRANGGLGKTRLLQESKQIIAQQQPHMLVSDIIDMYDFENRKPIKIERKLVDSLKREYSQKKLPEEQIAQIFSEYEEKYDYFHKIRGVSDQATREAESKIHAAFIESCNRLSALKPIVLRFDTLESLNINRPPYSFAMERERINKPQDSNENTNKSKFNQSFVLDWFEMIIARLGFTFILVAGRPPQILSEDRFISIVQKSDPLFNNPFDLSKIEDTDKLIEYLGKYGYDVSRDRIPYIRKITDGLPLLLTLYAKTQPKDSKDVKLPHSQGDFQDSLIERTFNLLENIPPSVDSDALANAREVYIFCLFILSCARRGIRREDLRGVFDTLGIKRDDTVINKLEDDILIRSVPRWYRSEDVDLNSDRLEDVDPNPEQEEHTLLLLHDEILALIDQSQKLDELAYRKPILEFLCDTSQKQVSTLTVEGPRFKLLSDHMYYELTRNITDGYRTYMVYADWLLRQRYVQDALILAEVFWATLLHEVPRDGGRQKYRPFYDKLSEALQVDIADIEREEGVRYVKRLRFSDDHAEAVAQAKVLYEQLVEDKVLPSSQDWTQFVDLLPLDNKINTYIYTDLCLTWATAMTRSGVDPEQILNLLTTLIRWLESEQAQQAPQHDQNLPLHRHLAYLRRTFFLGETYNIRGQFYRNQQFYSLAVSDLQRSVDAFNAYRQSEIPLYQDDKGVIAATYLNDNVAADIAQAQNNLAYSALQNGDLEKAVHISNEVIKHYIEDQSIASSYQQALFYNTNALIHMRYGDFDRANRSLTQARHAAEQSGMDRAIGLVAHAEALYQRALWNNGALIETSDLLAIDGTYFHTAVSKLRNEPGNLGEILYDRARFARDLVVFYRRDGQDLEQSNYYWKKAKDYLDEAAEQFKKIAFLNMQQANLRETQASLFILRAQAGDSEEAEKLLNDAEQLLRKGKDMPDYSHVIAGKISLQRSFLLLRENDVQGSLREMAIALARTYLFAPAQPDQTIRIHHDQAAFRKLIELQVHNQSITPDDFSIFVRTMYAGKVVVKASDLPYLLPPAERWLEAWEQSLRFFESLQEKAHENAA